MKICSVCETGNKDGAIQCKDCGASLGKVATLQAEALLETEIGRAEKRENVKKRWIKVMGFLLCLAAIFFFVIAICRGIFFISMIEVWGVIAMGWVYLFYPDIIFRYHYLQSVRNIGQPEPNEWDYFENGVKGVFLLAAGAICMATLALT